MAGLRTPEEEDLWCGSDVEWKQKQMNYRMWFQDEFKRLMNPSGKHGSCQGSNLIIHLDITKTVRSVSCLSA